MIARKKRRRAFTLVELLVATAVIAVLTGLLLPAFRRSMEASARIQCTQKLRQLATAVLVTAGENGGAIPRSSHSAFAARETSWSRAILPALGENATASGAGWARLQARYFRCPTDAKRASGQSYGLNVHFELDPDFDDYECSPDRWRTLSSIPSPSKTILIAEVGGSSDHVMSHFWSAGATSGYDCAHDRHSGKANYAFADGHIELLPIGKVFDPPNGINRWNPSLAGQP